jgi:hypothetical protein
MGGVSVEITHRAIVTALDAAVATRWAEIRENLAFASGSRASSRSWEFLRDAMR